MHATAENMATTINQTCCITDCKTKPILTCLGCPDEIYCNLHHKQHREDLNQQLENLIDKCNQFNEEIEIQTANPEMHALVRKIDEWKKNSIANIEQVAEETRERLLPHVVGFIPRVKQQLNPLTYELHRSHECEAFVDTDIKNWTNELERLKDLLNNPPYFTIRQDSTSLVTQISLEVGGKFVNDI